VTEPGPHTTLALPLVVDFDDFHDGNHRIDLLIRLKEINPAFRCTLFAIPRKCDHEWMLFLRRSFDWLEFAVHGDTHDSVYECADWSAERMLEAMIDRPAWAVRGFKAPGWQISDGCYETILRQGWWVADHSDNDRRRPAGILSYVYQNYPRSWHGHIQDVCGNGLEERFAELAGTAGSTDAFRFASEVAEPWVR
jgi:hypothetical protein